jgi:predicted porin
MILFLYPVMTMICSVCWIAIDFQINAGFAYQSESLQLVAKPNDLSTDYTRLNATYDLGVAKLLAAYGHVINIGSLKDAEATEWSIGADYPVTSTLILSGGYARSNHNDIMASGAAGLSSATNKVISFGGSYSLSKRTSIYAGYESHTYTKASTDIDPVAGKATNFTKHTFDGLRFMSLC